MVYIASVEMQNEILRKYLKKSSFFLGGLGLFLRLFGPLKVKFRHNGLRITKFGIHSLCGNAERNIFPERDLDKMHKHFLYFMVGEMG